MARLRTEEPIEAEDGERLSLREEIQAIREELAKLHEEDVENTELSYRLDTRISRLERAVGE